MAETRRLEILQAKYVWLCPLIASSSWFLTLSILLFHQLGEGRPVNPGQSNPYVAYEVVSQHLKVCT